MSDKKESGNASAKAKKSRIKSKRVIRSSLEPDFQNFVRRSGKVTKMTELTKILRKSYDNADFQNFLNNLRKK